MRFKDKKIYVAGHTGMVGYTTVKELEKNQCNNIIKASRKELDLMKQNDVVDFLNSKKPDIVIVAAARVGGIYANDTYSAEFIYQNIQLSTNLIHASYLAGVKRLLYLGSSCIYPRLCPQPMNEEHLLTGELEKTNEAYAIAKIASLKMCEFYRKQYGVIYHSAMPTNLFGPGDNYHLENSHVLPALMRRFHEAKLNKLSKVDVWGTGNARREFLYSVDLAQALLFLLTLENPPNLVNVGTGIDISINDLANTIKEVVGFEGDIVNDTSKPDGTPQKLLDVSLINSLGWKVQTKFKDAIKFTYQDFLNGYRSV